MANIVNNRLLVVGDNQKILELSEFLKDREKIDSTLSKNIYRIYLPDSFRDIDNNSFGNFPGFFSSEVSVYDIGLGKEKLREKASRLDIDVLVDQFDEDYANVEDLKDGEWLIFMFQSAYEEPRGGVIDLSLAFPRLLFMLFSEGEAGIYRTMHFQDGEIIVENLEEEEEEDDEWGEDEDEDDDEC